MKKVFSVGNIIKVAVAGGIATVIGVMGFKKKDKIKLLGTKKK